MGERRCDVDSVALLNNPLMKSLIAIILAATALAVAANVHADGPGAYRPQEKASTGVTPQLTAIEAYNAGYAVIQQADRLAGIAATATNESVRKEAQRNAQQSYKGQTIPPCTRSSLAVAYEP